MRILYLYCHPVPESFHGALRAVALAGLARAGHDVDLCDLYAESFDPVLRAPERRSYHDLAVNRRGLESYVDRLRRAEALLVQFPTWCLRRRRRCSRASSTACSCPGVAFDLSDPARVKPMLHNIRKLAGDRDLRPAAPRRLVHGRPPAQADHPLSALVHRARGRRSASMRSTGSTPPPTATARAVSSATSSMRMERF